MKTNHFNLCGQCMHIQSCVLTNQKEKVYSCSEFDNNIDEEPIEETKMTDDESLIDREKQNLEFQMAG